MKRLFLPATLVALMGVGAYFGHATAAPTEGLSDLELTNAEALAEASEKSGYAYVHPVHTDWYDGCNCTGKGKEQCCD